MPETPDTKQPTPKRRWRPRFSLLTLVLGVVFVGACGGLWWRWEPWVQEHILKGDQKELAQTICSPDGRWIATGSDTGVVRILNADTGQLHGTIEAESGRAWLGCFSPDSRYVLISSKATAHIWQLTPLTKRSELSGHAAAITGGSFSPDGRKVATAGHDARILVWDAGTGLMIAKLMGHLTTVRAAFFTPDCRKIVSTAHDGTVRTWDAETGCQLVEMTDMMAFPAIISPHGRWIIGTPSGRGFQTTMHDAATGKLHASLIGFHLTGGFSPDGETVITLGNDTGATVWESKTGRRLGTIGDVCGAKYLPDGKRIATVTQDDTLHIWDVETGRRLAMLSPPTGNALESNLPDVDSDWWRLFHVNNDRIIRLCRNKSIYTYSRRRPEYWWGIAWMPESWIALLSGVALLFIAVRNLRHRIARPEDAQTAQPEAPR